MGKPAARITDMHTCPMTTGPVPHVGGPVLGVGVPTVLIGGIPAAVMGDTCTCTGPPDTIILGSTGVFIGGKPAARMGDSTAHGGVIVGGLPTVLIGEASGAGNSSSSIIQINILLEAMESLSAEHQKTVRQIIDHLRASEKGLPFMLGPDTPCVGCHKPHC